MVNDDSSALFFFFFFTFFTFFFFFPPSRPGHVCGPSEVMVGKEAGDGR